MIQIAHAITNLDRSFAEADDAYCRMLQLSPAELARREVMGVTYHADRARNLVLLHRLVEQGTPFWIRKRYTRSDGGLVWVLNHVSRTVGIAGRTRIAAASFILPRDIPGRAAAKAASEHLATQTDMLKKLL